MSLFPAYATVSHEGDPSSKSSQSLSWLTNESCPEEVGQIPLPPSTPSLLQCEVTNESQQSQVEAESQDVVHISSEKRKEEKHKDKLHGKDRKKKKHKKRKDSSLRSRSRRNSRSRSRERSRSNSTPRSRTKTSSGSRFRRFKSFSRSRSRSRSSIKSGLTRRSHSRSGERNMSKTNHISQSENNATSGRRSGSLSRTRVRSRSRSGSGFRSGSRAGSRFRSGSRSGSRFRSRSRSGSRSRWSSVYKKSRVRRRSEERHEGNHSSSGARTSTDILVRGSKSIFLGDLNGLVKPEDAFYVDHSGDQHNVSFSSTHFSQLTRYRLISKTVFGQRGSAGVRKAVRRKAPRYFRDLCDDANLLKTLPLRHDRYKDYVPLGMTYEELKEISFEKDPVQPSTSATDLFDLEKDSSEDGKSIGVEYAFWQNKQKEYNERLGKEPSNISLWLEFVRFQNEAYKHLFRNNSEEDGDSKKKKVSLKALAERKLSILDSAIKKNVRSLDLQFERLEIGQDIWDDKKLKSEWASVLFNFPNKISVWHQYLSFTQTHFTSYSLSSVIGAFAKCTEKLQHIKSGVFITHAPPAAIGKCLVDITVQLAYVWKQGGYMERAIALFQALIELNLCAPAYVLQKNISLEERQTLFEPFWDSRAPRFGEEKAVGWAKVMENRQLMQYPEVILGGTQDEEDAVIAQGGTTADVWLALENSRERSHWLPWEQDPEDCEDPERMVSFDDISPHLYVLDTQEEIFYLLLNFFKFLGVPYAHALLMQRQRIIKRESKNELSETIDFFMPLTLEHLSDDRLFGRTPKLDFLNTDGKGMASFQESGPTLFSCTLYCTFVCEALQQASNLMQHPYRTELTVLFVKVLILKCLSMVQENSIYLPAFAEELKKRIKSTLKLKEFRACLPLYQQYGKFEEIMEHFAEAENVYTASLSLITTDGKALDVTHPNFKDIMNLYTSYIKLEFQREAETCNGHFTNNIISSLCYLVQDSKFVVSNGVSASGPVILKTKKKLQEMQAECFESVTQNGDSGDIESKLLLCTKLTTFLALLQLFTVDFKSACLVFETLIEKVKSGSLGITGNKVKNIPLPGKKLRKPVDSSATSTSLQTHLLASLVEEYLWLGEMCCKLDCKVTGERLSHSSVRALLSLAVEVAPENSTFLLQFALNQTWRDLLHGVEVSQRKSVLVLVSQILPHLQRTASLFRNADEGELSCGYRLESVLEKGVSCPPGRHCPLLWRIYLALIAATRPSGLKRLIYRAIASCPGVKCVYMDCIRLMPDMLKEIVALLGEKGLRVRLPLEELQVLTEAEVDQAV